jgi:hypothetical protein
MNLKRKTPNYLKERKKKAMSTDIYNFTNENEQASFSITKHCSWCDNWIVIEMSSKQHEAYVERTAYVQDIFPHITKEDREMLISGTHAKCWNEMFLEIDEDEEEEINSYVGNE